MLSICILSPDLRVNMYRIDRWTDLGPEESSIDAPIRGKRISPLSSSVRRII